MALVHGNDRWIYSELAARAGGLARHLRGLGVGPEVRVAVCQERSPDLVVALLGVLAAPGSFGADAYLKGLADTIARPEARVVGLHIFTMNQVPATAAWHQKFAQDLRG